MSEKKALEAIVPCGDSFYRCHCVQPKNHEGPHSCDCEGSWTVGHEVVSMPRVVVDSGGPFPVGTVLP